MTYRLGYKDIRALNKPITQKLRLLTRGNIPSLRNRAIPRAGVVHRSEIVQSHAQEHSIARKLRNPTRGSSPSLRNRIIPRVGIIHHPKITVMSVLTGSSTHYLAILYKKKSPKASLPLGAYRLS